MTIRDSLLAILVQGPCYGQQLRAEFERRTGGSWPLNVGQVHSTLDRLERDGLVVQHPPDEHGRVFTEITEAGRFEAASWLASPVDPGRDQFAAKLALAVTLPGVDATALVQRQRERTAAEVARLTASSSTDPTGRLIERARLHAAEAELRWLDEYAASIPPVQPFPLAADSPRRGRPAKVG